MKAKLAELGEPDTDEVQAEKAELEAQIAELEAKVAEDVAKAEEKASATEAQREGVAKKQVDLDKDIEKVHPTFARGIQATMRDLIRNKGN